jgi:hypothetical protein
MTVTKITGLRGDIDDFARFDLQRYIANLL